MALFRRGIFTSHAGFQLPWKIDCDALTDDDIETLAWLIRDRMQFGSVVGIPRGGLRLGAALQKYINHNDSRALIVDDVLTSGKSMIEMRNAMPDDVGSRAIGVVIFARGECPSWVRAVFRMDPW